MSKVFALAMVSFLLVACGGGAASPSPTATVVAPATSLPGPTATASVAPTAASTAPSTSASAGGETVTLAATSLGQVLVGPNGMTLYGFTPDQAAGAPTCYDSCAETWPPLTASDEITVGAGLDDSDFTLVARTDGSQQVQIGDYPLYYFSGDSAPGDVEGQGLAGKWFVVGADGTLIQTTN